MLFNTAKNHSITELFKLHFNDNESFIHDDLFFLVHLINYFRPKNPTKINLISIQDLNQYLRENPLQAERFSNYLISIFAQKRARRIISDSGIIRSINFFTEIRKKITANILPTQPPKESVGFILSQIFYKNDDYIWCRKIPLEELSELYDLLKIKSMYESLKGNSLFSEMLYAMHIITQRLCGHAMETDVLKMVPEYDNLESPFIAFERERMIIEQRVRETPEHHIHSNDTDYKQLILIQQQCYDFIEQAFKNSSRFGISLQINQSLMIIHQQLERLRILTTYLIVDNEEDKKQNTLKMMIRLIKYSGYRNNLKKLISEGTQLIAYEITQHSAKTGEHYITNSTNEYYNMFKSSAGGGLIVGILCVIKLLAGKIPVNDFMHALLYSLNYAIGFVIIYLLGFTLATKQPAMTAATIAKSIERNKDGKMTNYKAFAALFARLFRSQFIAFVGNILIAFPVSLGIVWIIAKILEINIVQGKSTVLFHDLNPVTSLLIFHAAIAGIFLFFSGIIAGNVANKNKYNQVYYRIEEHPLLKMTFGNYKARKFAIWFEKKWPGIISNIYFGFFMGSTAAIGAFIGLPLNIQHITFASGNLALALFGADFTISYPTLCWSIAGIFVIGFVNFMVSFSLSIMLAFRSRAIPFTAIKQLNQAIWNYFKKNPSHFFFPTK